MILCIRLTRYPAVAAKTAFITVQREGCGKVPHVFLERLDIIAGFDAVHSKSVAKIMDAEMVQASLFQDFLEFFPDSWLNVMVPVRMSENQSGEISFIPKRACD